MNTIDAVLFDLDGTILDTADDLGATLNYMLNKYQLPTVSPESYRPIASDGALGLLTLGFGEQLNKYDYDTLRSEFLTYYHENIAVHTQLYDGIPELITYLDTNKIPWGIVTNKPEGLTQSLLPYFPELANCQTLVGGDSLAKRKPDPLPINHALSEINIAPERCFYVGDAPRDIEAGKAANTSTIIAGWGYIRDLNICEHWQADFLCHHPVEIISLIND